MISIIIPVYNSERYLDRCIQSILNQSYKDFELLLINDGSTDSSGKICDKYATDDNRITVIHKDNQGVSSARNIGIDAAKGEWITFVDSDDWLSENSLLNRYKHTEDKAIDLIYNDALCVYSYQSQYFSAPTETSKDLLVNTWIQSRNMYIWLFLIKRDLLLSSNCRFLENVRFGEDMNFILKILHNTKKISHVKEALYFYNKQNETSAMNKLHIYRDDLLIVYEDLIKYFKNRCCYSNYKKMLSWCILEYKLVSIVKEEHSFHEIKDFHSESHAFIWGNAFLDFKSKLMLFCYTHHLDIIAQLMRAIYKFINNKTKKLSQ